MPLDQSVSYIRNQYWCFFQANIHGRSANVFHPDDPDLEHPFTDTTVADRPVSSNLLGNNQCIAKLQDYKASKTENHIFAQVMPSEAQEPQNCMLEVERP